MNAKPLKFTALGTFFSVAIFGFFISGGSTTAQKKQSDILEKAAGYKSWKQPVKPPPAVEDKPAGSLSVVLEAAAISIESSSGFG